MENELESTIWWHLVLMFPWKTLDLQFSARSICIYSWQLYGNLRGKPCIHEYCSSITMPHLKFRFLHCRGTCDADGLLIKCTAVHTIGGLNLWSYSRCTEFIQRVHYMYMICLLKNFFFPVMIQYLIFNIIFVQKWKDFFFYLKTWLMWLKQVLFSLWSCYW